jgi:hypothetical protein
MDQVVREQWRTHMVRREICKWSEHNEGVIECGDGLCSQDKHSAAYE